MKNCSLLILSFHSLKQNFIKIQRLEDVELQRTHLFRGQVLGLLGESTRGIVTGLAAEIVG